MGEAYASAMEMLTELIGPASSSNPFGGRLQQVVRMRYKGLNLEQNVCAQFLLPSDRGSDRLMVTKLALNDSGRSQLVEAFAQLSGLRLLIPDPRDPAPLSFTAPDAGLLRLLPIVGAMLLDKDRRGIPYHLDKLSGWSEEPPWRKVLRENTPMNEAFSNGKIEDLSWRRTMELCCKHLDLVEAFDEMPRLKRGFREGLLEMLGKDCPGDVRAATMHFIGTISQQLRKPIHSEWKDAIVKQLTTLAASKATEEELALLCAMAQVTLMQLGAAEGGSVTPLPPLLQELLAQIVQATVGAFPLDNATLVGAELPGGDKWISGVLAADGNIYGIPYNATQVLCFNPRTQQATLVGDELPGDKKWDGGVLAADGNIYGIPSNATQVLCFNPRKQQATLVGDELPGSHKWRGGVLAADGNIYGIPYFATQVLCFNPRKPQATLVGDELPGGNKWMGGVLAADGNIYGIPFMATQVLRFDPRTKLATLVGDELPGYNKWDGGVLAADGNIYGIPSNATQVLCFNPRKLQATLVGDQLPSGAKWMGGVLAADGNIYGIPNNATQVLRFDPRTKVATLVGDELPVGYQHWSGGVLAANGNIYGIPYYATQVLRIAPRTGLFTKVEAEAVLKAVEATGAERSWKAQFMKAIINYGRTTLAGDQLLLGGKNKWGGGVLAADGNIYGIPFSATQVLCFDPRTQLATLVGDQLPVGHKKWRGGVLAADGNIYGIPDNATQVLCFNPRKLQATLVGDQLPGDSLKWCGGVLAADGNVYGIPNNATQVLCFNPRTQQATLVGDKLPGNKKWRGGVLAADGNIYGIPFSATQVLCFNPRTQQATLVGTELPVGHKKWRGGVLAADGNIYGIPSNATQVLCFNPRTQQATLVGDELPVGYSKWRGGVLAADGNIYGIPFSATQVLRFDPRTKLATLVGDELPRDGAKWMGGVLADDGNIYGIPNDATQVLRIGSPAGLHTKAEAKAVLKAVEAKGAERSWKTHILLLCNNEFWQKTDHFLASVNFNDHDEYEFGRLVKSLNTSTPPPPSIDATSTPPPPFIHIKANLAVVARDNGLNTFVAAASAPWCAAVIARLELPASRLTVFAPTDAAFTDFFANVLDKTPAQALALTTLPTILLGHMVEGVYTSADLMAQERTTTLTTLAGTSITIQYNSSSKLLYSSSNTITVVESSAAPTKHSADVAIVNMGASNGIVHSITAVLPGPPFPGTGSIR